MDVHYRPLSEGAVPENDDVGEEQGTVPPRPQNGRLERLAVPFRKAAMSLKKSYKLFVVKPVLIFYGLQFAVASPVTNQLWVDRTCSVTFSYNETVCVNLSDDQWKDYEDRVQKKVSEFSIMSSYMSDGPAILISLYLGPLSDKGRKQMMLLPFVGHIFSGVLPFLAVYYKNLPPQFLWSFYIYILFGGYGVLLIAMFSYIGDMTNQKNRTTFMAIVTGLGILIFPLGEVLGGQLYKYGGYYWVYSISYATNIIGIIYVLFLPESIMATDVADGEERLSESELLTCWEKVKYVLAKGNRSLMDSYRCFVKQRLGKQRRILWMLLLITLVTDMVYLPAPTIGLLFVEKQFHWTVVDYTNFVSVFLCFYAFRTFVTTPILCQVLKIHDCMLAITGGLAAVACYTTMALATKGWMMYYAISLTLVGGIQLTPLKSLASKCVEPNEYGKVFTLSAVASYVASLLLNTILPLLYQNTLVNFPGAIYIFRASLDLLIVIAMSLVYVVIFSHEKEYGPPRCKCNPKPGGGGRLNSFRLSVIFCDG